MILDEVTVDVQPAIASEYYQWLLEHIDEMERFPGFDTAKLYTDKSADPAIVRWVIVYPVSTEADLESYFRVHAPRMREDGISRFGDQFTASRRILQLESRKIRS